MRTMDKKYRVLNEMDIETLEDIYKKSDLTHDEYWVLKYSIGNDTNKHKIDRLSICDRLNFCLATLTTIKRVALSKIYKVYKDHMNKLKD